MFGMGGTEILVILIVALLFLGPDKLPDAAKSISKGIRDLRKQTRDFQESIEADEKIGGAIRDLKSALNGEEPRKVRPPRPLPPPASSEVAAAAAVVAVPEVTAVEHVGPAAGAVAGLVSDLAAPAAEGVAGMGESGAGSEPAPAAPSITLPPVAGESTAADSGSDLADESKELAAMIKPAEGAIAKGSTNGHG